MSICDGNGVIRERHNTTFGLLYSRCHGCTACGHSAVPSVKCLLDAKSELERYPGVRVATAGCSCPKCSPIVEEI